MIFIAKLFIFVLFCIGSVYILSPWIKQVLEPEEADNFIRIMKKLLKKNGLSLFYKTSFEQNKWLYEYQEDSFLFEIIPNQQTIAVNVYQKTSSNDKKLLFEALIDKQKQSVAEQRFSNYTLKDPKKELKTIHAFLANTMQFSWEIEQNENAPSVKKIVHLKHKLHNEYKQNLNPTIFEICEKVIHKIEKISVFLDSTESSFSLETKHRFYQLVDNELIDLMDNFSKLSIDEQKKYEEKLIISLKKIEDSLSLIERNHQSGNIHDFEKTLILISKRYKD